MQTKHEHARPLLALCMAPGLGPMRLSALLAALGSAEAAVGAREADWLQVPRIGKQVATQARRAVHRALKPGGAVDQELDHIDKHGAWLLTLDDPAYPRLLRHIPDPPPLIWGRGRLEETDALSVGVVGSRRCTAYGREQAGLLAGGLALHGLSVVSGGAEGIDTAAHQAALRAGGRTVVVLGSGLAQPYPDSNRELFSQVVADSGAQGAVISELPMQTRPARETFPRRNRIISGLSLGVVLVEAARKGGAMITARQCVEDHGRELMALPGRVDSSASSGCHQAIREGWASLVASVADVLAQLGETGTILQGVQAEQAAQADVPAPVANEMAGYIHAALDAPRSLDELAVALDMDAGKLMAEITMMEIRGELKREGSLLRRP